MPLRLVFWLLTLPVRLLVDSLGLARFAFKSGFSVGRVIGLRRILWLAVGILVGLLAAPVTGRQLRQRLWDWWASGSSAPLALDGAVRSELRNGSRTWHLPQPEVSVAEGVVTLRGVVPHEMARQDIERAVAGVEGVDHVDNLLILEGSPTAASPTTTG